MSAPSDAVSYLAENVASPPPWRGLSSPRPTFSKRNFGCVPRGSAAIVGSKAWTSHGVFCKRYDSKRESPEIPKE